MDRTVVAKALGQLVPLAASAEAEDDAVDGGSPIDAASAAVGFGSRRSILPEDGLDALPEFVVEFPNGIEGLYLSPGPSHPCVILMRDVN